MCKCVYVLCFAFTLFRFVLFFYFGINVFLHFLLRFFERHGDPAVSVVFMINGRFLTLPPSCLLLFVCLFFFFCMNVSYIFLFKELFT